MPNKKALFLAISAISTLAAIHSRKKRQETGPATEQKVVEQAVVHAEAREERSPGVEVQTPPQLPAKPQEQSHTSIGEVFLIIIKIIFILILSIPYAIYTYAKIWFFIFLAIVCGIIDTIREKKNQDANR